MVVDDTQVPRALLSQDLCIQSPFLLTSSERHMTSHELVSEDLVYRCSEIVNETSCFYMVQNISGLNIHKGQKQESDETLVICKLAHHLQHFTHNYFLQFYIKAKKIREINGKILLIHFSHLNKKKQKHKNFLKEKNNTYGHQSVCVATEGPCVTDVQNWTVIKHHFNNQSLSTLLEEINGETSFLLFFSLQEKVQIFKSV